LRHSLTAKGYGIALRPVRLDDAQFIVWLRNLDFAKGRVGDSASDVLSQEMWLNSYFEREGDYYFVIETLREVPVGTYSIYNLKDTRAEIGRMVIRPDVPAAVPATLLLLDLFYEKMGLTEVEAITVPDNAGVQSLLRKGGWVKGEVEHAGRKIGGVSTDLLHFLQTADRWSRARNRVVIASERAEPMIKRWEQAYLQNLDFERLATET